MSADGDGRGSDITVSRLTPPAAGGGVGDLRRRVRAVLTAWGLAHALVEDMVTIANELVASVIEHARTSGR